MTCGPVSPSSLIRHKNIFVLHHFVTKWCKSWNFNEAIKIHSVSLWKYPSNFVDISIKLKFSVQLNIWLMCANLHHPLHLNQSIQNYSILSHASDLAEETIFTFKKIFLQYDPELWLACHIYLILHYDKVVINYEWVGLSWV